MVKGVLRGHAEHLPVALPVPWQVTNTKQYKLPGGHKEMGDTLQELENVGIIKPTHSPLNSPAWPVRKPDGSWCVTVDYRKLNKVTPPLHAAVPSIEDILDTLSCELGTYHYVVDLATAFFSVDIAQKSQEQCAFMWDSPSGHSLSFHRDISTVPPSVMDL